MPKKSCIVGGEIFEGPGSRCPKHQYKTWRTQPTARRVYDSGWAGHIRPKVLREEPTCRLCGAPSTDCDHIVNRAKALKLGWTEEQINARSNLQGLCAPCHRRKTAAEGAAGRMTKARRKPR